MAATKKKAVKPKGRPGRKPTQYVTMVGGMLDGPLTTAELVETLSDLPSGELETIKIFKLDHEVQFRIVPARVEITNGR